MKAKVFKLVPLKNTRQSISMPTHIVIDMFGSIIISTQKAIPTTKTGYTPFIVLTFSGFLAKYAATKSA